ISWRRLVSRASVPTAPRKYLVVTMVEALTDQKSGNSTPRCSKTVSPVFQLVCTTSRRSHVISSYGCTPSVLKIRSIFSPPLWAPLGLRVGFFAEAGPFTVSVNCFSCSPYELNNPNCCRNPEAAMLWCARRRRFPTTTPGGLWVIPLGRVVPGSPAQPSRRAGFRGSPPKRPAPQPPWLLLLAALGEGRSRLRSPSRTRRRGTRSRSGGTPPRRAPAGD